MSVWQVIKRDFEFLRRSKPGRRFQRFRRFKRRDQGAGQLIGRLVTFFIGVFLIAFGLAIGWIPGPGGFVAFIGLALIAREIPGLPFLMDRCEVIGHAVWNWFLRQRWPIQGLILVILVAVSVYAFRLTYWVIYG